MDLDLDALSRAVAKPAPAAAAAAAAAGAPAPLVDVGGWEGDATPAASAAAAPPPKPPKPRAWGGRPDALAAAGDGAAQGDAGDAGSAGGLGLGGLGGLGEMGEMGEMGGLGGAGAGLPPASPIKPSPRAKALATPGRARGEDAPPPVPQRAAARAPAPAPTGAEREGSPAALFALQPAQDPLRRATRLKELGPRLQPLGPVKFVKLQGDGPVGLHIVQVGRRVLVAACAVGLEADRSNAVHFGDQIVSLGGTWTRGLKLKEVKSLIADSERPLVLGLQPLSVKGGSGAPLKPPCPEAEDPTLWGHRSRAWALEDVGAAVVLPDARELPRFVVPMGGGASFVGLVETEDGMPCRILEVDGEACSAMSLERAVELILASPRRGGGGHGGGDGDREMRLVVVRTEPTGARRCPACGRRGWIGADFCWRCGERQANAVHAPLT